MKCFCNVKVSSKKFWKSILECFFFSSFLKAKKHGLRPPVHYLARDEKTKKKEFKK